MSSAIQVRGLKKSYGSHIVLKGLDFQIEQDFCLAWRQRGRKDDRA